MDTKKFRVESDLLGELQVPVDALYGVQTQRAINNYKISGKLMSDYPDYVISIAYVKLAAIQANHELGIISDEVTDAVKQACQEIIDGKHHENFPIDVVQGGAGTSVNMCANEVIANRALEILGGEKGDYKTVSPNDHINCGQSTNDAYPTTIRMTFIRMNRGLVTTLESLISSLRKKGEEFASYIKMGRTQLQDAVPMTIGQEFNAFANTLEAEVKNLNDNAAKMYVTNMGGTAIGTCINAKPGFSELCTKHLAELTGEPYVLAEDLIAATSDTGDYVSYSSALKRLAVKLSKVCNDLRLLASGPRCGLNEINLPPMAPGSSIMPGKVNPVIPEVTNQVCFKIIGNDMTIAMAAEAGQLQLNVMEPVMAATLIESITWLSNAMKTLEERCIEGITANAEHCETEVANSIGIVTALNPYIGYKKSTVVAKEAMQTGKPVAQIVIDRGFMSKELLEKALDPVAMTTVHEFIEL